jgi:tape measure domain-containing protein
LEIARLQIAVDSLQARLARLELERLRRGAGDAERSTTSLSGASKKLGIALAGMVSAQALMSIQKLSEEFLLLQSRVSRMSGSAEEAAVTYGRLSEIANITGASLAGTVKLWESLNLTLKDLGGNNNQVLRFTETLQKIGAIGGSSADEMSNALRQLGQSFAGGVVRAEEFNSILENMPALAREIATGLGVPFSELRALMLDGGLTAEKVLVALQKRGQDVDKAFAQIPRTVAQASNALTTDLGNAISSLDKAIGASSNLAKFLDTLAKGVRFTGGDFTDIERLNQLTADRARLQASLAMAERRTILTASQRASFDKQLVDINSQIVTIQDRRIKQIKEEAVAIGGNSKKAEEDRKLKLAGFESELRLAGMTARARAQEKAERELGLGATQKEIEKARDLAGQTYDLGNAHKSVVAAIKLRKIESTAALKAEKALNAATLKGQAETVAAMAAAQANKDSNKALLGQVDPITGENQKFQKEMDDLRLLNANKLLEDQRYLDLKAQAETAHDEQIRVLQEENFRRQSYGNELLMASLDQLQVGATNALVGLATGASNGEDAIRQLATSILNEGVGALVQMGVQVVKNMVMGQAAQAASTATSVASAATATAAWTPAAAAASIGSFGGAAAAGLAGMAAAIPAMIGLLSFDGGGFTGLGSRSGGMDGKGGFPAMLHPNETVIDHTKGQTTGGGVTVNVIESNEKAGTQEKTTSADGSEEVNVFVADIFGDGPRSQAIRDKFGLSGVGR